MQELPVTISNSKILVVGFGRIGKILAHKLYGLNTEVYVTARKYEDFAWIEAFGYKGISYDILEEYLEKFDVVFNTVPALMLDEKRLKKLRPDSVIIDLASNPGGAGFGLDSNNYLPLGAVFPVKSHYFYTFGYRF